ncbi:hypothetical protein AB834_06430 [PVC group bacterium (ex Bugula neritina AB1)]|nr:hypothetical protein AB834_06430 [PVC group bacterium (ex Bugula neritina AB1)]
MKSSRGMTLVEVIVAITLGSIVTSSIGGTFYLSLKSYQKNLNSNYFSSSLLLLHSFLLKNLESLFHSTNDPSIDFEGNSSHFSFISLQENSQGIFKRQVSLNFVADKKKLEFIISPVKNTQTHKKNITPAPILKHVISNVTDARFSYYSASTNAWASTPQSKNEYPLYIRVEINSPLVKNGKKLVFEVLHGQKI